MQDDEPQIVPKRPGGAVILGGAHGTLALARSFGRRNIPVWLVSNDNPLPRWSRYVRRSLSWPGPDDPEAAARFLIEAAKAYGLEGFLLVPAADAEVRFVSQSLDRLLHTYRILLPAWDDLQWACEKSLLYQRAERLGLDIPPTYRFDSIEEAAGAEIRFPVVLKPSMGGGHDSFTRAKVTRADDRESFITAYRSAAAQVGLKNVVVQEMIPGGKQLSYAAFWNEGQPVAEFSARRARQFPVDFGYTSTFVEVTPEPEVIDAARRFLSSINHCGLVEIEFKRDERDGKLRLLDVNPRPWSWFGLAAAAHLDLGALLWTAASGRPLPRTPPAQPRVAWMYLVRDLAAAIRLIVSRRLTLGDYLESFFHVRAWAAFSMSDVVPGLVDIPLTLWRVLTRRFLKLY